ncbi:hypothetical protein BMS3Bbin10_00425 [bacterium BMS3Bbin10]|nr:hypothetical protein BMS3Bbin10_00425 [bacterium BMS3Bbin10]HDL16492.1 hypothetical protein [Hyphomicrobiales bacterium]
MSKRGEVYLAVPLTECHSATKEITERIQIASHMADRQGLKRVVSCLALAIHILEEEEKVPDRPRP